LSKFVSFFLSLVLILPLEVSHSSNLASEITLNSADLVMKKAAFIQFLSNSETMGEVIKFEDVTVTQGIPPQILEQLSKLDFGPAEKVLSTKEITAGEISKKLRELPEKIEAAVKIIIPNAIRVKTVPYNLTAPVAEKLLSSKLQLSCPSCIYQIKNCQVAPLPELPNGTTAEIETDLAHNKGPSTIKVVYSHQGKVVHRGWVSADIRIKQKVPVATKNLPMGQKITQEEIKFEERDITFVTDSSPSEEQLIGAKTRRTLRAAQVLLYSDIEREKAVNRGESIDVVSVGSDFIVSMKGVAQESGSVGDMIKVLNANSKKIIMGKVSGSGKVEIK
jgi:flagella basal body P-ring formation protein FlgA